MTDKSLKHEKALPYYAPQMKFRTVTIPRLYARKYLGRIIVQTLLILLMVETIFMTEKLNDVLRVAAGQHVGVIGVLLLLLYRMPEIFNLAAPLALLAAAYRVTLQFREERELLALSGIGVRTYRLLLLTCGVGVVAQILSLAMAGFVTPAAVFAQRSLLFESYVSALRGDVTSGQFYRFSDYIILARHSRDQTTARQLFLHQTHSNQADEDRVVLARSASLDAPRPDGVVVLRLEDFDSFNFRSFDSLPKADSSLKCANCIQPSSATPTSVVKVGKFEQQLEIDDLLRFDPRGRDVSEWTLADVLGFGSSGLIAGPKEIAELGHRLSRSLLCMVAPLIAGLALALTTRRTQTIALPLASAALMGLDICMAFLAEGMAPFGATASFAAILLMIAVISMAAIAAGLKYQDAIVRPALGRA